jgi:hypothetical protein
MVWVGNLKALAITLMNTDGDNRPRNFTSVRSSNTILKPPVNLSTCVPTRRLPMKGLTSNEIEAANPAPGGQASALRAVGTCIGTIKLLASR